MLLMIDFSFDEIFLESGNLLFNGIEFFSRFIEKILFNMDKVKMLVRIF